MIKYTILLIVLILIISCASKPVLYTVEEYSNSPELLSNTKIAKTTLDDLSLKDVRVNFTTFTDVALSRFIADNLTMTRVYFKNAEIIDATIENTIFENTDFVSTTIKDSTLKNVRFKCVKTAPIYVYFDGGYTGYRGIMYSGYDSRAIRDNDQYTCLRGITFDNVTFDNVTFDDRR